MSAPKPTSSPNETVTAKMSRWASGLQYKDISRDAVYQDLLPGERVQLHTAYAQALARDPSLAGDDASVSATLALHWYAAHDLPRALAASVRAGREALDALRVETGRAWYGPDVSEENLLHEAGLVDSHHSFTKGCYIGQEVIARLVRA